MCVTSLSICEVPSKFIRVQRIHSTPWESVRYGFPKCSRYWARGALPWPVLSVQSTATRKSSKANSNSWQGYKCPSRIYWSSPGRIIKCGWQWASPSPNRNRHASEIAWPTSTIALTRLPGWLRLEGTEVLRSSKLTIAILSEVWHVQAQSRRSWESWVPSPTWAWAAWSSCPGRCLRSWATWRTWCTWTSALTSSPAASLHLTEASPSSHSSSWATTCKQNPSIFFRACSRRLVRNLPQLGKG